MKIAICDDEKVQLDLLKDYCIKWARKLNVICNFKFFESAEEFLFNYEDEADYDLLLLDIEMSKISGMDLAKKLRSFGDNLKIVFITGNSEYVFDGYSVEAIDYIMKPVKEERLHKVLDKVYKLQDKKEKILLIQSGGVINKVNINSVYVIESIKHDILLHIEAEEILYKKSISDLEKEIGQEKFYRCHRSYLINLSKIVSISKKEVILEGNKVIPIARGKWEGLNKAYLNFYRGVLCK